METTCSYQNTTRNQILDTSSDENIGEADQAKMDTPERQQNEQAKVLVRHQMDPTRRFGSTIVTNGVLTLHTLDTTTTAIAVFSSWLVVGVENDACVHSQPHTQLESNRLCDSYPVSVTSV